MTVLREGKNYDDVLCAWFVDHQHYTTADISEHAQLIRRAEPGDAPAPAAPAPVFSAATAAPAPGAKKGPTS